MFVEVIITSGRGKLKTKDTLAVQQWLLGIFNVIVVWVYCVHSVPLYKRLSQYLIPKSFIGLCLLSIVLTKKYNIYKNI